MLPPIHVATGFIDTLYNKLFTLQNEKEIGQLRYVEYDENKQYLYGVNMGTKPSIHQLAVSNEAKYIRISLRNNDSTALDLNRLKLEKGNKATDWTPAPEDVQAAIDANASALSDFEGAVTTSISGLQAQIDGVVDSWFYAYTPTTANYPASEWNTTELKQRHIGDTFTNTQAYVDEATTPDAGKSWRWVNNSSVYSWTPIADSDAVKALLAASTAQDTADGKRRVFTTTPTTPYDKGDLWSGGASGDLKISTTTRAAGSSYVAGDWVLATKYTDDTAVTSLENALGNLAYEDMVGKAKLDSTIIDGGYIKTSLINANTIAAGTLIVSAINDSVDAIQVGEGITFHYLSTRHQLTIRCIYRLSQTQTTSFGQTSLVMTLDQEQLYTLMAEVLRSTVYGKGIA